jgi:microcystin degradation protein MlrC
MKELEELARQMEEQHKLPAVNVVGGFAFADTPDTGVSFSICGSLSDVEADELLDELCDCAWQHHAAGNKVDPPLEAVLAQIRAGQGGLTVVVEPSDNIGGGAPGDCTGLLRAFVQHRLENAAICLNDPQAVAKLQLLSPGERMTLPLGGKGSRLDEGPFALEVELVSINDGRFALEDRNSHLASMYGERFDMGKCAVVRHGGLTILLTSIKTPPFDLGQWRSQGIAPEKLSVIGVKAAVAHRRAYDPIAARMLWVDTPGPCRSDLKTFPYRNIRRPIWPLDS